MDLREAAKGLDQVFYYILLAILVLISLMHLFVFVINWEGWFFGIRMAGLNAGIVLFLYFLVSAGLAYLLFRYPQRIAIIALLSIFFFSFRFIDSAVTIQSLSGETNSFSGLLAALVVIPLIVLVVHLITSRFYEQEVSIKESGLENKTISGIIEIKEPEKNIMKTILILIIAAVAIVFFLGPVVIIPGIILLLLFLILLAAKRRYDAKKSGQEIEEEVTGREMLLIAATAFILIFLSLVGVPLFFLFLNR